MDSRNEMIVTAVAKWNKEKSCWVCSVKSFDITNQGIFERYEDNIEVAMYDEFVLPYAILESNGINAKAVFEK